MSIDLGMYINKCRSYINMMLSLQQWSGLQKSDIDRWLENFNEVDQDEKYIIYKLLTNLIYFSESDVLRILSDGVYNHLFGELILAKQIESRFQLSPKALQNIVNEALRKTCFVPLLDGDAPHESGNYICRLLVQQAIINPNQSVFSDNVHLAMQEHSFNRIVIVDDCVGSGNQLRDFWNVNGQINENGQTTPIKNYCEAHGIRADYLVLFGYDRSIVELEHELTGINIKCVKLLSNMHRVFDRNSYFWDNPEEQTKAYEFFERITEQKRIELLGYANLDFAFIMDKTIPDWSLPLLWRDTPDWKYLLRRKNSSV